MKGIIRGNQKRYQKNKKVYEQCVDIVQFCGPRVACFESLSGNNSEKLEKIQSKRKICFFGPSPYG